MSASLRSILVHLIEARYTHGIRHINTDDNGDEDRIKNRVFSVTVGFRLR